MVDEVAAHYGRLDILVNCIGLNREEKAEEVTEEMFDYVCDVNLKSAMFQAQAAARHMIRQGERGKAGPPRFGALHARACADEAMRLTAPPKAA